MSMTGFTISRSKPRTSRSGFERITSTTRKNHTSILALAVAGALGALCGQQDACAAPRYWDTSAGAGNGVGGTGSWGSAASSFSTTSSGDATLTTAATTDDIIFAGTAGTVTLAASQTANSIAFNTTGYLLNLPSASGNGATLTGPITLANNVALSLQANPNNSMQIGSVSGGNGSSLTLSGTPSNSSTYRINLSNGATIAASAPVTISGPTGTGTIGFVANNTAAIIDAAITNNTGIYTMLGAIANATLTVNGDLAGSGSVRYTISGGNGGGAGVVVLNGVKAYTGSSSIVNAYASSASTSAGIVRLGTDNALPKTALIFGSSNNNAGGAVDLNGHNQTVASLATYDSATTANGITNTSTTAATLTVDGSATTTFGSTIGAITASNLANSNNNIALTLAATHSGVLTLAGANTFTGATTLSGGTLKLANALAVQNSTVNTSSSGGTLTFEAGTAYTLGGLTGNGNVALVNTAATPSAVTLSVGNNGTNTSYSGILSGPGGVTKIGAGVLSLAAANTHSGATVVTAGAINLANANALQYSTASGALTFDSDVVGQTFLLGGLSGSTNLTLANNASTPAAIALSVGNNNADTTYSGVLSGPGSLTKLGAGTLSLRGTNTFTGTTFINGGTLSVTSSAALGANTTAVATINTGTLAFANSTSSSVSSSKKFSLGDATSTVSVVNATTVLEVNGDFTGTGTLNKAGAGTLYLNSFADNNVYHGLNVREGTLRFLEVNDLGSVNYATTIYDGAILSLSPTSSSVTTSTSRDIILDGGNATVDIGNATQPLTKLTLSGDVGGTGTLVKTGAGTLTLSKTSNSYSGGTTINGGTLSVASGSSLGPTGLTNVIVFSGNSTLQLTGTAGIGTARSTTINNGVTGTIDVQSSAAPYNAPISGGGTLAKSGTGTLRLTASNSYTGGTTVSAGTLRADHATSSLGTGSVTVDGGTLAGSGRTGGGVVNVTASGILSAGTGSKTTDTPGNLTIGGTTNLASGSTYAWKIASTATTGTAGAGTNFDLLSLATLNIASGGVIVQLTAGNAIPTFTAGQAFEIATTTGAQVGGTQINTASPAALAGFANLFTLSTEGLNLPAADFKLTAVADGVTGVDLYIAYSPAPEPTTAALVGLGASVVLGRRRREERVSVLGGLYTKRRERRRDVVSK